MSQLLRHDRQRTNRLSRCKERESSMQLKLKTKTTCLILGTLLASGFVLKPDVWAQTASTQSDAFAAPARGFVSKRPAARWENALPSGNGTMGALVMGNPFDETLFLSHAGLYLPRKDNDNPVAMAKHLDRIRELCLAGKFKEAGLINDQIRDSPVRM